MKKAKKANPRSARVGRPPKRNDTLSISPTYVGLEVKDELRRLSQRLALTIPRVVAEILVNNRGRLHELVVAPGREAEPKGGAG